MEQLQRLLLNKNLLPYLQKLDGRVLDIGGKNSPYRSQINATKYEVLDVCPEFEPDYKVDVHNIQGVIANSTFDSIIATEVLEHCYDPATVISEFHRILKHKGVLLLSVPFLYPYHPDPQDYYRYTKDGLKHLFHIFSDVKIIPYGGRFAFFWEMSTWVFPFLKIFNKLIMMIPVDTNCPSGFVVFATK